MSTCPKCQVKERQIKYGRTAAGSQRYRCNLCGHRYTPNAQKAGYDEEIRLQALRLYLDGVSLREVSRVLDINHQTVANWVNGYANQLPLNLPPSVLEIAILDGLVLPSNKRSKRYKPSKASHLEEERQG
jgi:transposase-like protein